MVVALIASSGKDNTEYILNLHMTLRIMGGEFGMEILGGAGDGAASELAAQNLMDCEATEEDPMCYKYARYGVQVRANIYTKTGPFISHQDPPHGAKTGRNQPLHGTKASSLGTGFLSAQVLMSICTAGQSGLVRNDVFNVDKQDDGAARRFYGASVLEAATTVNSETGEHVVDPKYSGLFVYNYFLGKFDLIFILKLHALTLIKRRAF